MIHLDNVSKVYRKGDAEVRALDGFSLHVETGEFVAVRGRSGSGKSTLLLTVGGMVRPTSGSVQIAGSDIYAMSAGARTRWRAEQIGFVFQMFHLLPYLNVLDNVQVPHLAGASASREDARKMLEHFGLGDRLMHNPAELSTGERQRVAVARALITQPRLILADEPTGNLDPDSAHTIMDYLKEYHEQGGTVLLVTHEELAEQYAQRTVELGKESVPAGH
jgi:ABC-type lipoprotein export system ATPase subunit